MSESIETGNIIEGKVVKIKPFGAIVSLPNNAHGLVHISHISSEFVQDINTYIAVGDTVKVKVLSVDDNSKISLSMKEAAAPPKERKPQAEQREPRKEFKKTFDKPKSFNDGEITFEDKLKDFLKNANDRQASLNKRNKKR